MQFFRQHIFFRLFWIFLAIHILNYSVDTPDAEPDCVPEDLSYNDMESVVEIVVEEVFDIKNAIAEHDEKDCDEGGSFDLKKITSYYHQTKVENIKVFDNGLPVIISTPYQGQFNSQFNPKTLAPPPKV